MRKKKILLLQGGKNEEHEVSINTGNEVYKALLKLGYKTEILNVEPKKFKKDIEYLKPDCCFNALHGSFGEDGTVQKILFDLKIPFTHSGISASKIGFNKDKAKNYLKDTKINLLKSEVINTDKINEKILNKFISKYKSFVIKPLLSGSSYGVQIIRSSDDIKKIYLNSFKKNKLYIKHKKLIIEKYIKGRELTVTVIEKNKKILPIAVTEILSKNNFFDYQAKYSQGYSKHVVPASLEKSIYNKCLIYSKEAHDTLGCNGVTRSDFILNDIDNKLYFLEINTQPGLTPVSLVPEQLKYKGINFLELIKLLVKSAKCQK